MEEKLTHPALGSGGHDVIAKHGDKGMISPSMPKRKFKIVDEDKVYDNPADYKKSMAEPKAEPKTGSVEYFEKQKEKFKGTKYEKIVDDEIEETKNKKSMAKEIKENMKDLVKLKKLSDIVETSKKEYDNKEREITAMMTKVKAPTGTKKEIAEMIEALVTDPVDRQKLKLNKRDKNVLQTIYINTVARHDWYKKNKPRQPVDYDLD